MESAILLRGRDSLVLTSRLQPIAGSSKLFSEGETREHEVMDQIDYQCRCTPCPDAENSVAKLLRQEGAQSLCSA